MNETEDPKTPETDDQKPGSSELNSPKLDEQGKPTQKAVSDAKQAHGICKQLKKTAIEKGGRLDVAGDVASIYNGRAPFDQKDIVNNGQDWRGNFSTGFLPSIVDRVTPQMRDPIFRADFLTHSTLPLETAKGAEKSRKFCEDTTKLIRGWRGWNDFVSLMTQDTCLHGQGTPGSLDADWRPRLFRPDQCFLFEGSEQHASKLQIVVFWQAMLIHDFLDLFRDKESAAVAKYNLEGCIAAANQTAGSKQSTTDPTPLEEQDAIREKGMLQLSAENQAKTVNLFHLFVREYDGKLALWTVSEEGAHEIRHVEDCEDEFESTSLEDVIALFTLQVGNGKFYGSKGLGRLLANIHIACERNRCLAFDQQYLSGLVILQVETGDLKNLQPNVQHPFIIVQGKATIAKEQIQFNATDWKILDDMLTGIAESIAGAFLPPNLNTGGSANTKIEAAQKAEREIAVRQGVLGRFFAQFADLIAMIQRKVYCARNLKEAVRIWEEKKAKEKKGIAAIAAKIFNVIKKVLGKVEDKEAMPESKIADQEAVECIVGLLDYGLSVEEIVTLAHAPAGNDMQSNNAERDMKTLDFIAANFENPHFNKSRMSELAGNIAIGEDRTSLILNKEVPDPDEAAREMRQQIIEFSEMVDGNYMPAAPTDNHALHRKALGPKMGMVIGILEKTIQGGMEMTPGLISAGEHCLNHYMAHIQLDKDTPQESMAKEVQVMQSWGGVIEEAKKFHEEQQKILEAALAEKAKMAAEGGQPGAPAAPGGEGGNGNMIGDAMSVRSQLTAEQKAREDAQAKNDRLQLDREKFEHQRDMDVITMTRENTSLAMQATSEALKSGMKDAADELKSGAPKKATP